jgi:hypothetical protein
MKSSSVSIQWLVLLIVTNTIPCQAVQRRARGVSLPENRGNYLPGEEPTRALKQGKKKYGRIRDGVDTVAPTQSADPTQSDDPAQSDDGGDNIFDHGETAVINTEDQYLAFCQERLLSDEVAGDGLISQKDIANFAEALCDILDDEDLPDLTCPTPEFTNLSVEVQLLFVWFICPQDDDLGVISCLADFVTSGFDFGYEQVESGTEEETAADVLGFCCSLIPKLVRAKLEPLTGEFLFRFVVHLHAFSFEVSHTLLS